MLDDIKPVASPKLVYFMRAADRVGRQYLFQGSTDSLGYRLGIYFFFIVSGEAAEWIEEQNKTRYCYLLHDELREILDSNSEDYNGFIDDVESEQVLDISGTPLETIIPIVDISELKEVVSD